MSGRNEAIQTKKKFGKKSVSLERKKFPSKKVIGVGVGVGQRSKNFFINNYFGLKKDRVEKETYWPKKGPFSAKVKKIVLLLSNLTNDYQDRGKDLRSSM